MLLWPSVVPCNFVISKFSHNVFTWNLYSKYLNKIAPMVVFISVIGFSFLLKVMDSSLLASFISHNLIISRVSWLNYNVLWQPQLYWVYYIDPYFLWTISIKKAHFRKSFFKFVSLHSITILYLKINPGILLFVEGLQLS